MDYILKVLIKQQSILNDGMMKIYKSREEYEINSGSPLEPDFPYPHLDPPELADNPDSIIIPLNDEAPF